MPRPIPASGSALVVAALGGTDGGCGTTGTGKIWGNNLSGNYRVDAINGSCIELCTCQ